MIHPRTLVLVSAILVAWFISVTGGTAQVQRQVRNVGLGDRVFRPVTDSMLEKPDPGDWINWRRTYDGTGYSPLTQINRQNVGQLKLAWSWGMPAGAHQPTPLVHDGVMFVPTPGGGAQALDAANGDFLWEFRAPQPHEGNGNVRNSPTRNIAIYGDKIYVTTGDARLIALNARTGEVAWDTQVMDPKMGYTYTAGALAVRGVIITSLTGCGRFKNDVCYILGHDAQTGKELWRTSTVARPGEPGGDTWDNQPLMFRAGSDAWITGSYDPVTNLVYWGTAQAKPWAQFQRGTAGDALYTNSTLALDPNTGKMAWYFQHFPGETHDMDETFERVLVDVNGRQSVFTMGKVAVLVGDRSARRASLLRPTTRDIRRSSTSIGRPAAPRTARTPSRKKGVEFRFCPSTSGFKSLRSMAYHPATRAFYIPLNLTCEDGTFGGGQARRRRRRLGPGATHQPDAPGKPRRPWRAARDGCQRQDPVAASHTHTAEHVGPHDGRRPGARRALGQVLSASTTRRPEKSSIRALGCPRSFRASRLPTPSTANNTSRFQSVPAVEAGPRRSSPTRFQRRRIPQATNSIFVFALPERSQRFAEEFRTGEPRTELRIPTFRTPESLRLRTQQTLNLRTLNPLDIQLFGRIIAPYLLPFARGVVSSAQRLS